MLALARELVRSDEDRWLAYELIASHAGFGRLSEHKLEELGRGVNSWWTVDAYARTLTGPAWLNGQISAQTIRRWADAPDLWWRRVALVSTVALNTRSQGGPGDTVRTLAVCRRLVADRTDLVAKAMSWALRALVPHDPRAVQRFLCQHQHEVASLVVREVTNKLRTGLKNPRRPR